MNLLIGNIKNLFFKYLGASFGSALIVAIYSIVDTAMVGQYEGSNGVAALATVAPIWNIIYSLGLLVGIGGAVKMSTIKGNGNERHGNEIFSVALIGIIFIALLIWALIIIFETNLLSLFGADATLLPLAKRYMICIKVTIPLFVIGQFLAAFLRNDNAPIKATAGVMAGGIFNIFGDYFFVFLCNMGIFGAGLATALGQVLSVIIMISHFLSKKCMLKWVKPQRFFMHFKTILEIGFSTFFVDLAMGILAMLFNKQIMFYFGPTALAVYGVIININILVQSCGYGIGQAMQPIASANFGAKDFARVKEVRFYSIVTTVCLCIVVSFLTIMYPIQIMGIFLKPSVDILLIAKPIMQIYFISFLLMPFNVYATYYFQAILQAKVSFIVSVLRGLVISGILIYVLPLVFVKDAIWWVMPICELITFVVVLLYMRKYKF